MKTKTMYKNARLRYMYIYVNHIIKSDAKEMLLHVTWWRQDEKTGKIVSMDLDQEMWIKKEDNEWVPMDDSIEQKVFKSWRV